MPHSSLSAETLSLLEAVAQGHHKEVLEKFGLDSTPARRSFLTLPPSEFWDALREIIPTSSLSNWDGLLVAAAGAGQEDIVRRLLPVADPLFEDSRALSEAAGNGHLDVVELLIPLSHPQAKNSEALVRALEHGQYECAQKLLPVSDPNARDSYQNLRAPCAAARSGNIACLKLILAHTQNIGNNYWQIFTNAMQSNNLECVELIFPHVQQLAANVNELVSSSLIDAAVRRAPEIVAFFLKHNSSIDAINRALYVAYCHPPSGNSRTAGYRQSNIDLLIPVCNIDVVERSLQEYKPSLAQKLRARQEWLETEPMRQTLLTEVCVTTSVPSSKRKI